MSGASVDDAHQRCNVIQTALAADSDAREIKVGFAALAAEDSAAELIRSADADLPPAAGAHANAPDAESPSWKAAGDVRCCERAGRHAGDGPRRQSH